MDKIQRQCWKQRRLSQQTDLLVIRWAIIYPWLLNCLLNCLWHCSCWTRQQLIETFSALCIQVQFPSKSLLHRREQKQKVGFVLKCIDFTGKKSLWNSNKCFWSCTKKSHLHGKRSFRQNFKAFWAPAVLSNQLGTLQVTQICFSPFYCCLLCGLYFTSTHLCQVEHSWGEFIFHPPDFSNIFLGSPA